MAKAVKDVEVPANATSGSLPDDEGESHTRRWFRVNVRKHGLTVRRFRAYRAKHA